MSRLTYDAMLSEADAALTMWNAVIIDATFLRRADRERAQEMAKRRQAGFVVLECRLPEDELKQRLEKRAAEVSISDGTWQVYLSQKSKFEPVTEIPIGPNHVIIDALRPVADNVRQIIDILI